MKLLNSLYLKGITRAEEIPELTPLTDYIWGYGLAVVTAIMSVLSLFIIFSLIKIGFRIQKASQDGDTAGRSEAIKDIIWVAVGAAFAFSATIAAGIFTGIFLS